MSQTVYDFHESLGAADPFESSYYQNVVVPRAALLGGTPEDVRHLKKYRDIDVDFVIHQSDGDQYGEGKVDHRAADTGNLFVETISNVRARTQGCMVKSLATYMHSIVPLWGKVYIYDLRAFMEYWFGVTPGEFQGNLEEIFPHAYISTSWASKTVSNYDSRGGIYETSGYTCPIKILSNDRHTAHYFWKEVDLPPAMLRECAQLGVDYFLDKHYDIDQILGFTAPEVLQWLN